MELVLTSKYLTFPINTLTAKKKVCFYEDGKLIFDLDCKIDMINPNFTAFVDVERFKGKKITLTVSPEMKFSVGIADEMNLPGLYSEPMRPQIHFTVPNGWNNDPNGLVFINGVYHMFYQYNPCATEWGNMHWGHAVSRDLIHWENRDIALFPDEMGTMYSGSAIVDRDDMLGLGTKDKPVVLLFYTAAAGRNLLSGDRKPTQCIAYSTDGGESFTKYSGNPVVEYIDGYNRDPKVVFVPEIGKYVMALFIKDNLYRLYSSENLVNWQLFCDIPIENESECPDIYPLECEGVRKWVIEGARDIYLLGHFEKEAFVIDTPEKRLTWGNGLYAAQSYSGIPDGKIVKVFWERSKVPGERFSTQMGIPAEMHLEKLEDGYYLAALPIRALADLRDGGYEKKDFVLKEEIKYEVGTNALDIVLKADYDENALVKLGIFGHTLYVDMVKNLLTVSCAGDIKMPLSMDRKTLDLRIVADRTSVEIFADNGKMFAAAAMICDFNLPAVTLSANKDFAVREFDCYTMKSIWKKEN